MPSLKEVLKERITSKEQFDAALVSVNEYNKSLLGRGPVKDDAGRTINGARDYNRASSFRDHDNSGVASLNPDLYHSGLCDMYRPTIDVNVSGTQSTHFTRWWMLREHMRVMAGVYDLPAAMYAVYSQFPGLAPHRKLDEEDPLAVHYTPDPVAGERDAQVRTTLGRLLRKLYPHISDDAIRDHEAAFRSEIVAEVEFLTDADDIVNAYTSGPSSCMAYSKSHWGYDVHPVEVYSAPGMALAVSRNSAGVINGRAVTYVNPNDPEDKRYVRLYGDPSLARRLQRRGFRLAGLAGARLRRLVVDTDGDTLGVLVPYFDAPGGGGGNGDKSARGFVLDEDPNYIVMVADRDDDPVRRALRRAGANIVHGSGRLWISPRDSITRLKAKCPITGATFTPGADNDVAVYIDDEIKAAHADALAILKERGYKLAFVTDEDVAWVPGDRRTFKHGDNEYLETDNVREALGYVKLDEQIYGKDRWVGGISTKTVRVDLGDRISAVLWNDTIEVVAQTANGPRCWRKHLSYLKDREVTKIHRVHADTPAYAEKGVEVVTTISGRTCVPNVHDVVKLVDGRWDFARNASSSNQFGVEVYFRRDDRPDVRVLVGACRDQAVDVIKRDLDRLGASHSRVEDFWFWSGRHIANRFGSGVLRLSGDEVTYNALSGYRPAGDRTDRGVRAAMVGHIDAAARVEGGAAIPDGFWPYSDILIRSAAVQALTQIVQYALVVEGQIVARARDAQVAETPVITMSTTNTANTNMTMYVVAA